MPQFRQGSVSLTHLDTIVPLAAARAGTVNKAGGLSTNIDAHGYKSATLVVAIGVVGTSVDCKVQSSATSGGSYADITGAAITQVTSSVTNAPSIIDFKIPVGQPFLQTVLVTVGSTTVCGASIFGHGPMVTNQP